MLAYSFIVPFLPLASFVILVFAGRRLGKKSAYLAISAIFVAFVLTLPILFQVVRGATFETSFKWFLFHGFKTEVGFLIDPLSSLMLVVVTLVALMVQVYSLGYMAEEARFSWYYTTLSLFSFAMLLLVISNNYLQMFICWELVGLCSYLLIGFWFEKEEASAAAKKAFLTTKVGDIGFFIGIIYLYFISGSFNINGILRAGLLPSVATVGSLLLFLGAVGKSAQFPLHVWLPDAMEGPTPVSALIHAATMVAAGVYLVGRSLPLFEISSISPQVVMYVGAFTALMAATIALVMTDIKKVLAYSTISQLGYMMMALGAGGYVAGIFHLTTHAFFKSLLFLCAGSVIHATHTSNIFEMGGLSKKMKVTTWTFIVASLALAGVPPFSGFFSKDEILLRLYHSGHLFVFLIALLTGGLTAFYIFRVCFVTFWGKPEHRKNKSETHVYESPKVMTIPLVILAVLAFLFGLVNTSLFGYGFSSFLTSSREHAEFSLVIMSIAVFIAGLGILAAWAFYYKKMFSFKGLVERLKPLYELLSHKYWIDEIYRFIFVTTGLKICNFFSEFDKKIIDGVVNGVGALVASAGRRLKTLQVGYVQSYMLLMLIGFLLLFAFFVFKGVF